MLESAAGIAGPSPKAIVSALEEGKAESVLSSASSSSHDTSQQKIFNNLSPNAPQSRTFVIETESKGFLATVLPDHIFPGPMLRTSYDMCDPITLGILTYDEAKACFDIFFQNCHQLAPLLCLHTQRNPSRVRNSSTLLFFTICTIGARFWNAHNFPPSLSTPFACQQDPRSITWLHPRYTDLVTILDQNLTRLVQPSPADVTLETVQALLLYVQWMPLDVLESSSSPGSDLYKSRSHYTNSNLWSVLGLAIRQAIFIGLDKSVDAFNPLSEAKDEDIKRLRVWINLLYMDQHLALTTKLPMTLDPVPTARIARAFASHSNAQSTDLQLAGLCELVAIGHRAAGSCRNAPYTVLDDVSLQKVNAELNEWQSIWSFTFCNSGFEHYSVQIPFTTLRWYRLALNFVALGPIITSNHGQFYNHPSSDLRTGIEAAISMLYCFSANSDHPLSLLNTLQLTGLQPLSPLIANTIISTSRYNPDTSWITYAYAVVILALSYDRNIIDDEFNIAPRSPLLHSCISRGLGPRKQSPLYQLLQLVVDVFDRTVPVAQYRDVVQNTFRVLTQRSEESVSNLTENGSTSKATTTGDIFATIIRCGT
ncbi:hypothetical protein VKT23_001407 [Stygiomarasmius scandens]|uniref:Xylanolytic transcriptional activator regulatory domain-containing protein n=1 Tax=Marasmiellus scandens TaxID=2682957 RepID=A0ABR1K2M1_9AGAR